MRTDSKIYARNNRENKQKVPRRHGFNEKHERNENGKKMMVEFNQIIVYVYKQEQRLRVESALERSPAEESLFLSAFSDATKPASWFCARLA